MEKRWCLSRVALSNADGKGYHVHIPKKKNRKGERKRKAVASNQKHDGVVGGVN